eukprot:GEMP01089625.1.p1 GENE.GEMP01089625.1~~GEMP01089625.1.p1  ORF type:complete len:235 (+),score=57.33 GEMP01089625.1:130-834(+)
MVPWAFNAALPLWVCLKQDCRLSVGTHIAAVSFTNDDGSAVAAACSAGAASDVEIPAACGALTPPAFGTYAICDANVTNAPVAALVVVGTDTTSVACQTLQDCSFTLTGFGLEGVFVDGCSTSGTDSCTASEIAWGEFNDVTSLTWGPEVLTSGIHKIPHVVADPAQEEGAPVSVISRRAALSREEFEEIRTLEAELARYREEVRIRRSNDEAMKKLLEFVALRKELEATTVTV